MAQESISKMKFQEDTVKIPQDIQVELTPPARVKIKGKLGSVERDFGHAGAEVSLDGDVLHIRVYGRGRRCLARLGTVKANIKNMIIGVTQGFTYKLKIVQSHFPMSVKVQGGNLVVENFAGEKYPRVIRLPEGVKVQVKGDDVIVTGIDKYLVGLAAGRIEQGTRITRKDLRKFLDGIYIYEKKIGMG
ncbi:50S ribosomal protein L6 [Candidatus Calditenuaceae archaeon HR02]|nr:50S ribosomal protein L6 [Candidatus Calditenuaceae archaeon HR02]